MNASRLELNPRTHTSVEEIHGSLTIVAQIYLLEANVCSERKVESIHYTPLVSLLMHSHKPQRKMN